MGRIFLRITVDNYGLELNENFERPEQTFQFSTVRSTNWLLGIKPAYKKRTSQVRFFRLSCEGWDRTSDLRVMSPTSYRCSTSRCGCKSNGAVYTSQNFFVKIFRRTKNVRTHQKKSRNWCGIKFFVFHGVFLGFSRSGNTIGSLVLQNWIRSFRKLDIGFSRIRIGVSGVSDKCRAKIARAICYMLFL